MAELLKTKRIGSELEELISSAKKYICIFSYSLIIDDLYLNRLKAAGRRGITIHFVFGVEPKETETLVELTKIPGCKVYFKPYLHAKFYYDEENFIVSSMNLSEVSERKNYELGVLFTKSKYPEVFDKIKAEAREIIEGAAEWKPSEKTEPKSWGKAKEKTETRSWGKVVFNKTTEKQQGHCVRCQDQILLNTGKPLCYECYLEWADWENEDYPEKYCHTCGKKKDGISFAKPECYSCYTGTTVLS